MVFWWKQKGVGCFNASFLSTISHQAVTWSALIWCLWSGGNQAIIFFGSYFSGDMKNICISLMLPCLCIQSFTPAPSLSCTSYVRNRHHRIDSTNLFFFVPSWQFSGWEKCLKLICMQNKTKHKTTPQNLFKKKIKCY